MKENNNIDELFRSGLEGQRITPSERSWNKLDAALSGKQSARRRKKRNRFLFFSLLLLLLSYPIYKFFNQDNTETVNDSVKVNSEFNVRENKTAPESTENSVTVIEESEKEKPAVQNGNSDSGEKPVADKISSVQHAASINPAQTLLPAVNAAKKNPEQLNVSTNNQTVTGTVNPVQSVKEKTAIEVVSKTISPQAPTPSDVSIAGSGESVVVKKESHIENSAPVNPIESKLVEEVAAKQDNLSEEYTKSQESVPSIPDKSDEKKTEIAVATGKIADGKPSIESPSETKNNTTENPVIVQKHVVNGNVNDQNVITEPKEKNTADNKSKEELKVIADSSMTNGDYISASDETRKPLLKRILSNFSVGVYYSPDYVKNRFKVNEKYTGTASQDEGDYDNIKAAFSYSTGAFLRYDIGSRWSIGSGISYSTFSQTAVYNTINVVVDSVYRDVHGHNESPGSGPGGGSGHGGGGHGGGGHGGGHGGGGQGGGPGGGHHGNNPHNPPGGGNGNHFVVNTPCGAIDLYNVPPHHNSGNVQNGDTLNIKTETSESIHFINIPLTVRYKFGKGKWSTYVETGASLNIVNSNEVRITVNDAYTEDNEHDGLKKLSYSLILGAGVQYNFYKGLNLFLHPTFRYSITPINQYNPMDSYPYFIGVGAGMSIHF